MLAALEMFIKKRFESFVFPAHYLLMILVVLKNFLQIQITVCLCIVFCLYLPFLKDGEKCDNFFRKKVGKKSKKSFC